MSTNYPSQIDNDINIITLRDNISEIGSDVVNSIKGAVIVIEKYVGTTTGSTISLTARINRALDNSGNIRISALNKAGLITGPITNSDVDVNANIAESKLNLEYGTAVIQTQVDTLRARQDAYISETLSIATILLNHRSTNAVAAHLAKNIFYDVAENTYFGTPAADPFFTIADHSDVQGALSQNTDLLRMHKEAVATSSIPFGEHNSSAIFFNISAVSGLTSSENVQNALEDAFNLINTNMVNHNDDNHSNGIVRNTQYLMAEAAGYLIEDDIAITFVAGSSVITFAALTTLITDGVSAGDTIIISGSTSDDGTYQVNSVFSETQLEIVGTLLAADGGNATADVRWTSLEGASPAEWSCNVLNCTEHTVYNNTSSSEVFVSHPAAAAVFGGEIDFPALALQIWNLGINFRHIFRVRYNDTFVVDVDLFTGGYISNASYAALMQTLSVRNIVRAINKFAVDGPAPVIGGHYPFHAFVKDKNQIAIAHDFAEVDAANPTSAILNDTIRIEDGVGANSIGVRFLGFGGVFGANTIGVGTTAVHAFPNYNNYYYVNGVRSRQIRCITENGSARSVIVDIAGNTASNFRLADGTAAAPADFELRPGDVVRFSGVAAGVNNRTHTINTVNIPNITLRNTTGVVIEPDVKMIVYRNVISINYDAATSYDTKPTLYRVGIGEDGNVFKHRRLHYVTGAVPDPTAALKIVNCSKTLAGASGGTTTYHLLVGNNGAIGNVDDDFGVGNIYTPTDYNSIWDDEAASSAYTLQFDDGEVIQIDEFNTMTAAGVNAFDGARQIYRVYSENHIDWIDVEIDYDEFVAAMVIASSDIGISAYEELDEEKNLMLGTCLYTNTLSPVHDNNRFSSIVDERFFGTLGDQNVRSDFKENMWEANRGMGNYVLNGLLLTVDDNAVTFHLRWSGGSAFIGGHRVDFDGDNITSDHLNNYDAGDLAVYAMEYGEIVVHRVEDGRPQAEHVILGTITIDGSGEIKDKKIYPGPNYVNLNEKLLITVSQDPKEGMFTDIKLAMDYVRYVMSIRNSFHDKLLAGNETYGATIFVKDGKYLIEGEIDVPDNVQIIGSGRPIFNIDDAFNDDYVLKVGGGPNLFENLEFEDEFGAIVNRGVIGGNLSDTIIRNCKFSLKSLSESAIYGVTSTNVWIENCYIHTANRAIHFVNSLGIYCAEIFINNNIIETSHAANYAIIVADIENIKISNNVMTATGGAGNINISENVTKAEFILIEGNTLKATGSYNIYLTNINYTDITNNIFDTSNGIYCTNTASHAGLGIIDNAFKACDQNVHVNIVGLINSFSGLIISNNGCNVGAGGTYNVYITGTGTLLDSKITGNVLASDSNKNIYINSATVTDINISGNTISNTNNQHNIDILTNGTISDVICSENCFSAGTNPNVSMFSIGALNRIQVINSYIVGEGYNINMGSSDAIKDVHIENNYIDSSSIVFNNIIIQNAVASERYYIDNNTIILSGASGVENILIDANANLNIVWIKENYIYSPSITDYNINFDGVVQVINIEDNYIYNNGDGATKSFGNIQFGSGGTNTSENVKIKNNYLYAGGDSALVTPNILIGFNANISNYIIEGNNITNLQDFNVYWYTATLGTTVTGVVMANNIMSGTVNVNTEIPAGCLIEAAFTGNIFTANNQNILFETDLTVRRGQIVGNYFKSNLAGGTTGSIDANSIYNYTISSNTFQGGASSDTAIYIGPNFDNLVIATNVFDDDNFSTFIGGNLTTAALSLDKVHVVDNFPPVSDWTFRTATDATSAAHPSGGGGDVWFDIIALNGWNLVDDSINWKDKYITAITLIDSTGNNMPGNSPGDASFNGYLDALADSNLNVCSFYTGAGNPKPPTGTVPDPINAPTTYYGIVYNDTIDTMRLASDDNSGFLYLWKDNALGDYAVMIHISYSPDQGQY